MKAAYKLILVIFASCIAVGHAVAQTNGSNSTYSRFGLGLLNDQSQGTNRAMGGVSQGLRSGYSVNKLNPASYSAIDSLTFIFDVGMSLQRTKMKLGNSRQTANNTNFEYVNIAFRALKNVGMSIGFQPYTSVGYSFSREQSVGKDDYTGQNITNTFALDGSGGLHEAYIGAGWRPFKWISVGANAGLLWGSIDHQLVQTFLENGTSNTSSYSSLRSNYSSSLRTWKGDVGLQVILPLNKADRLTLGATVGLGHKIGGKSSLLRTKLAGDTAKFTLNKAFELPMTYSIGAAWSKGDRLEVAADATLERWADCTSPTFNKATGTYEASKGEYNNRLRINAGVQYTPDKWDHNYISRICYRAGAYYASPYQRIGLDNNTMLDGPAQYGITAGVGLPIANGITRQVVLNVYSPSYVNIGLEWARRKASSTQLISENVFRINIGITFNELWFQKWKFK